MRSLWTLVLQNLVPHMLESPFTSQSKQATFLPPLLVPTETWVPWADTGKEELRGPLAQGTTLMRGLPKPPLTDWPMVIPSIFRAGTCFMGFRAWNSSENCGDEALVDWAAWPELAKAESGKQEAPRLLPTCTSLPWERPWLLGPG